LVILTERLQTKIPLKFPKISLPGELWLLVCDTLGPSDRKALAQTCQTFWSLINAKAPFLSQSIKEDIVHKLSPSLLALRLSFLASAVEVRWSAASFLSPTPLPVDEQSSGPILRTLSGSTALQSLELTRFEVSPSDQQVILGIPTLRKLTLCDSICVPTTVTLPSASIHVLVIRSLIFEQTAFEHLFRILADSLETLELGRECSNTDVHKLYSLLECTALQRFARIQIPEPVLFSNFNHPFLFHQFITVLHVSAVLPQSWPSVFPETFLPKLHHLSAPWRVAELLIPGRPVQVFCDTELEGLTMSTLKSRVVQMATSASDIEELELCSGWSSPRIFNILEKHLPHLKRLRLLIDAQTWYNPRQVKEHMKMEPKFGVQYAPLQELELRMEVPPKARQPHQVSRPNCRKISTLFIPICPALEVLSFIVTPNKFKTNEQDIPPRCIFKLQRTANGTWEERGFGIKVPDDAKGFPMVDYKL